MTADTDYLQQSCDTYLNSFRQKRQLPRDQEQFYIKKYQDHGDKQSLDVLVESCMSFVMVIAREFRHYNVPFSDLVQEGSIGLLLAIKKYDTTSDIRLLTYASYWIRAYMYEYIIKNTKVYKVVANAQQRKLFFNIKKYRGDHTLTADEISIISDELNVDKSEIVEMEQKLFANDVYLDHIEDEDGNTGNVFDSMYLIDQDADTYENFLTENHVHDIVVCVTNAVNSLPEKQRYVIRHRLLTEHKTTLETIGKHLSVTSERVRQIEKSAIENLRTILKPALADIDYIF